MKKNILFLFIMIFSVSSWGYKISSKDESRYNIDYFRGSFRMMKVDYDRFGDKKDSKRLGYYNFIPLYKNGEIVGYGAITHIKSYNKHEALLAIISPEGKLIDFYLPDANDKHQEVHDYNWKNSYIGKKYDEMEFDGLAGSTFIANSTYGELKSILRTFEFRKKDIVGQ